MPGEFSNTRGIHIAIDVICSIRAEVFVKQPWDGKDKYCTVLTAVVK